MKQKAKKKLHRKKWVNNLAQVYQDVLPDGVKVSEVAEKDGIVRMTLTGFKVSPHFVMKD